MSVLFCLFVYFVRFFICSIVLTLAPLTSMTELSSVDSGKHYNTFLKDIQMKRELVITSCIGPG